MGRMGQLVRMEEMGQTACFRAMILFTSLFATHGHLHELHEPFPLCVTHQLYKITKLFSQSWWQSWYFFLSGVQHSTPWSIFHFVVFLVIFMILYTQLTGVVAVSRCCFWWPSWGKPNAGELGTTTINPNNMQWKSSTGWSDLEFGQIYKTR